MTDDFKDDEMIAEAISKEWFEPIVQGDGIAFQKGKNIGDIDGLEEAFDEARMEEVQETLDNLVELGLLEECGVNNDGEIVYQQTELGRMVAEGEAMTGLTQDIIETTDGTQWFIPGHVPVIRACALVHDYLEECGVLDEYNDVDSSLSVEHIRGCWENLDENGDQFFNSDGDEPWTVVSV